MIAFALTIALLAPPKEPPKVLAQTPILLNGGRAVIRNDRDLGLHNTSSGPTDRVKAQLEKNLKVKEIDWDKHMVLCISGGKQKKGGLSIELKALSVKDGKLVVSWKYNETGGAPERFYPELVLLIERFDGEVVFDPDPTARTAP
ncbi:MAG TPA: hypothetical protein VGE74_28685 [Gemmata sp.]